MRSILAFSFLLIAVAGHAQHSLERLWETDTTLAIPESVLYHNGEIYVSLIDGQPWGADGKGEIARLDKNGKIMNATWTTGLNAPKGMAMWGKKLYVADITEVAVINVATGKVESKIPAEGAAGLNDLTVDSKGTLYVSDSKLGKIYRIKDGKAELYLSDLPGVNGLKAVGADLYILCAKGVLKADVNKKITLITSTEFPDDGIEPVGNGDYVITSWNGVIYYLDKAGKMQTLLDTRDQKKNSADIGYDPAQHIVYVPTFFKKSVVAYKLKP